MLEPINRVRNKIDKISSGFDNPTKVLYTIVVSNFGILLRFDTIKCVDEFSLYA